MRCQYEGFPDLGYLGPFGRPAQYQLFRGQDGDCCPTSLGFTAIDNTSSGHSSQSEAYTRLFEHNSRPPIQTQSADIDRVESPFRNRESNFQGLGISRSRHVCNSPLYPPSSVHVSDSGATSTGGGCSVSGLAGKINVHVSAVPSAQNRSHSDTMCHPGSRSNTDSSLVANTAVVSTPTLTLCGSPSVLSIPPRPAGTSGTEVHLRRKVIPSGGCHATYITKKQDFRMLLHQETLNQSHV